MGRTLIISIISGAVVFQFTAAFLALRLIRVSGRVTAWVLVACALTVMGVRRLLSLVHIIGGSQRGDLSVEVLGLVISLLMVAGIALIRPLFEELQESRRELLAGKEELERINRTLEERVAQEVQSSREKDRLMVVREREAAMGEMVSAIAHQWKQPLNNLALTLQALECEWRDGVPPEEVQRSFATSMELIRHMSGTIDEFRAFFVPQKVPRPFSLAEAVARTLRLMSASYAVRQIRIQSSIEEDSRVTGAANEFAQVLLSLLQNCQEAFADRSVPEPHVAIRVFREGGRAVVTISDNAGGISADISATLFDRYESTKDNGSGIGLYLARMIVERHLGGDISARNVPGGAEFRITV